MQVTKAQAKSNVKSTVLTVRAVSAEFVRRILKPMLIAGFILAALLLALGGWLTTKSAWWWFLEAAFIIGTLLFIVLTVAVRFIVGKFRPQQSQAQKAAVSAFVDKWERVSEGLQTPQFIILYRIIRDVVRPKPGRETFIASVSRDSKTLGPDFEQLRRQFDN